MENNPQNEHTCREAAHDRPEKSNYYPDFATRWNKKYLQPPFLGNFQQLRYETMRDTSTMAWSR